MATGALNGKESERNVAAQQSDSEEDNDYLKMKALTSRTAAAVIHDAAADTRPANALAHHVAIY